MAAMTRRNLKTRASTRSALPLGLACPTSVGSTDRLLSDMLLLFGDMVVLRV